MIEILNQKRDPVTPGSREVFAHRVKIANTREVVHDKDI